MPLEWSGPLFFTLIFLPIYLALRAPFFQLPLHMDTGFYVSNHTICTRRFNFSKGWNATFAGCSKVLPEFFYSAIYLWRGGKRYKRDARLAVSLYNYVVAVFVGGLVYLMNGCQPLYYYIGVVTYALLSSEPQYGVYFEQAEQFEVLFHVTSIAMIFLGLQHDQPWLIAGGIGVWLLDAYFIKLSSLLSGGLLAVGTVILMPESLGPLLLIGTMVCGFYGAWVWMNGKSLAELLNSLWSHEAYLGHEASAVHYLSRFLKKSKLAWELISVSPILPGLAVLGAIVIPPSALLVWYVIAVVAVYLGQEDRVWYYLIPCLPPLAILATFGVGWIVQQEERGVMALVLLGGVWFGVHLAHSYGRLWFRGLASLNRYVWRWYGARMADKNLLLETCVPLLETRVRGHSLLVHGAWNQAYVLLSACYDTPIISIAPWLDVMAPHWQAELRERVQSGAPDFLLDTDGGVNAEILRTQLGQTYRIVETFGIHFRLFVLEQTVVSREGMSMPTELL